MLHVLALSLFPMFLMFPIVPAISNPFCMLLIGEKGIASLKTSNYQPRLF